ncbi:MAG: tetratricopeptide repeat protein, partial [Chloroflexota bacterium]|nr:tetratricopeptide repeat protein [Chloroflexota bacterium]
FCLFFIPWASSRPNLGGSVTVEDLRAFGSQVANIVTLLYLFTFFIIGASAIAFFRDESPPQRTVRPPAWRGALYGVALVAMIPTIVVTNLNVSRADVFNKQGTGYERSGNWDAARILYEEALRLQPNEDRYYLNMGRALMEKARTLTDDPAQRDAYLQQARNVLEQAQASNPLNTDHTRNLANLHRAWAALLSDPTEKASHLAQAHIFYEQAVQLSPNNAALWNEWATLHMEQEQYDEAREKLEHSLALDDRFVTTYLLLGNLEVEMEQYEAAIQAYDRALEVDSDTLTALSGKALALSRLERMEEAIQVNRQALQVAPDDYVTLKNLALLYRDHGNYDQALQSAQAALAVARPEDRAAMEAFIRQLNEQERDDSSG